MQLPIARAYEVVAGHGVFALDCCDKCGRLLGAVRYTRRGELAEWCSRECRGTDGSTDCSVLMPPVFQSQCVSKWTRSIGDEAGALLKTAALEDEASNLRETAFVFPEVWHLVQKIMEADLGDATKVS